jgi:hypothetical protein
MSIQTSPISVRKNKLIDCSAIARIQVKTKYTGSTLKWNSNLVYMTTFLQQANLVLKLAKILKYPFKFKNLF